MIPELDRIDHVHVYVSDRVAAEIWYMEIMGFERIKAYEGWAVDGGPLTLESRGGAIHLALFERTDKSGATTTAFGVSGKAFLDWIKHLETKGLPLRINDHDLAYSMYFEDPDKNLYEITTYDHTLVRAAQN